MGDPLFLGGNGGDGAHANSGTLRQPLAFRSCEMIVKVYVTIVQVLDRFLKRSDNFDELVHYSFNYRKKLKLKSALWFATKNAFTKPNF